MLMFINRVLSPGEQTLQPSNLEETLRIGASVLLGWNEKRDVCEQKAILFLWRFMKKNETKRTGRNVWGNLFLLMMVLDHGRRFVVIYFEFLGVFRQGFVTASGLGT